MEIGRLTDDAKSSSLRETDQNGQMEVEAIWDRGVKSELWMCVT